nr:hypothetical protein KNIQTVNV_KNIQTVNV_CDS_0007 [Microvirus sp.]CAI9750052.1 hypothetical protein KNIQTVNV_KNIQTVNV_CDS_0008 [Microvirus sp.]
MRTIPTKIGNVVSAAVGYRPPVRREDSPLKLRAQHNRRCDIRKFCVGKFSMS